MNKNRVSPLFKFSLLLVFSIGLMIIDTRSTMLKQVRVVGSIITLPFEALVQLPFTATGTMERFYPDSSLFDQYEELRKKQAVLDAKLQRFEAIEMENQRLAKLLSASRQSTDEVLLSEIVNFGLEPFNQKILVNRGVESGVYLGQPAISPDGVLGQVSETGYLRSVITLITDPSHGLPVQIERNGLRTIIHGSGKPDRIVVPYLESQADIQTGDTLVTSGMGGRFPVGYKVATVTSVVKDANEAFMKIEAQTTAQIGFTKEVLLLWNTDTLGNPRPPHSKENPDG
jgi:rod shape-determining protein MreC